MKQGRIARDDHHGHRLAEDLPRLAALVRRRRALAWIASTAGTALIGACGGGGGSSSSSTTTAAATTSTTTSTTATTTTTASGSCVADPAETAGPYPADGTNTASGSTSDILAASGIVRGDIRASFLGSTTVAQGVAVVLTLTLVNTSSSCAPLAGYAIYLWHCDRSGSYSLYGVPTESYLRGVQVTNSLGQVTFTTIFPACYSGRYPHMHFEVFASLATATTGRNSILTSQFAMPLAVCNTIYPTTTGYGQSATNLAQVSISTDNVFGDDTATQIAAMTPAFTGSVTAGYTATATIGVAP